MVGLVAVIIIIIIGVIIIAIIFIIGPNEVGTFYWFCFGFFVLRILVETLAFIPRTFDGLN